MYESQVSRMFLAMSRANPNFAEQFLSIFALTIGGFMVLQGTSFVVHQLREKFGVKGTSDN